LRGAILPAIGVPAPALYEAQLALAVLSVAVGLDPGLGAALPVLAGLQRMDLQYRFDLDAVRRRRARHLPARRPHALRRQVAGRRHPQPADARFLRPRGARADRARPRAVVSTSLLDSTGRWLTLATIALLAAGSALAVAAMTWLVLLAREDRAALRDGW
jgi:hypothetical protein